MTRTYSTEGPICPYCACGITPDDPFFYDDLSTELECEECGKTFAMEVQHSTAWACETLPEAPLTTTRDGAAVVAAPEVAE
jgi:hypothetical protein